MDWSRIGFIKYIVFLLMVDVCLAEELGADESSQPNIPMCGEIDASERVLRDLTVDPNLPSASFILVRSSVESVLEMELISPSGIEFDSSVKPPVVFGSEGTVTYYIVPNPEPGKWTVAITAIHVPECGEGYCIILDTSGDVGETVANPAYEAAIELEATGSDKGD